MLMVDNISFSYGEQQVLNDVSLSISEGEIVGLIGENGVGKSTLMKIMCGLRIPNKGDVILKDKKIGALIEEPALYKKMSVKQNIEFFRVLYGENKQKAEEVMKITGLNNYPNKKAEKLSMGMKKRLGIAIALLASEKIVLLDEPTNGLDPTGIRDMLSLIKELSKTKGTAFLISSHVFQDLESVCDTYYRLKSTKLKNVYDNNEVYGYYVTHEGSSMTEVSRKLDTLGIINKVQDNKIYVKYSGILTNSLKKLNDLGMRLDRRKLSEVYFE